MMKSLLPKPNIVILLVLIMATACSGYKHRYQKSSITLETTPCFGECPLYKLTINGNGEATLNNQQFTMTIGQYKQKFSPEVTNELFSELANLDWNRYEDEYETYYADLPGSRISFRHKKIYKDIYIPGGAEIPDELKQLIERLEGFRHKGEWMGEVK